MRHNIPRVRKSVVPKHLNPKLEEHNRISTVNLLNPENRSLIAIRISCGTITSNEKYIETVIAPESWD